MTDTTIKFLSINAYQILLNSNLLESLENQSFQASDLPIILSDALTFDNFCLRNYKPILKKLISVKRLQAKDVDKLLSGDLSFDDIEEDSIIYPRVYRSRRNCNRFHQLPPPAGKIFSPEGYFKVYLSTSTLLKNSYSETKEGILGNYNAYEGSSHDVLYISISEVERYVREFKNHSRLSISTLVTENNITWTKELLTKFKDVWDWRFVQANPFIKIDFDLIDLNYEKLDWSVISFNHKLDWNRENIHKWKDHIVWDELCQNEGIFWTSELISEFSEFISFDYLSSNTNVDWSENLIEHYQGLLNWENLSGNPNLPWSEEFIAKYYSKFNWYNLSSNPNLPWNYKFLRKYESKLKWIPEYEGQTTSEDYCTWPCISSNAGILWDQKLLREFRNKLDFWIIAKVGKISPKLTVMFEGEFDKKVHIGWLHHRHSDWSETERISASGWQNLTKNPNFILDADYLPFFYKKKVELSHSNGNLAWNGKIITQDARIIEILKAKENSLTAKDLIDFEFCYSKFLINEHFINESIWINIVEPFITQKGVDQYILELGEYLKLLVSRP
jgi:hypothetical protein